MILTEKMFKIASKLTSFVTILANIALAGDHILQVLAQYSWILSQCLYMYVKGEYFKGFRVFAKKCCLPIWRWLFISNQENCSFPVCASWNLDMIKWNAKLQLALQMISWSAMSRVFVKAFFLNVLTMVVSINGTEI